MTKVDLGAYLCFLVLDSILHLTPCFLESSTSDTSKKQGLVLVGVILVGVIKNICSSYGLLLGCFWVLSGLIKFLWGLKRLHGKPLAKF